MSKPFQLLKSFTKEELDNFQRLLDSGYLATNKRFGELLKILRRQALLHENLSPVLKCIIYQSFFSTENTKEELNNSLNKKLNRTMNDLLRAAEKFLMFEKIKQTDEHDVALLFTELIIRNQNDLCYMRIKAVEKKLKNVKKKGVEFYDHFYQIQRIKAQLTFLNNTLAKEDNYDELQKYGDIKFLLQKLQYHLAKITLQRAYAHKVFNLKPFVLLRNLLNFPEYQTNPLIKLYLLNIQLVEKEEEIIFLELKKMLREKKDFIPADFLKPFYTNLTNHCTYQLSKGDLNYLNYVFEIYKDMHHSKLLVKNNNIDVRMLKNIITIACRVKEFEWAVNQLAYYIKFIRKGIKQSVFKYNVTIQPNSKQFLKNQLGYPQLLLSN